MSGPYEQEPVNPTAQQETVELLEPVVQADDEGTTTETPAVTAPVAENTPVEVTGLQSPQDSQPAETVGQPAAETCQLPGQTAQDKIDQALELCNFAQQMWEKGKIEEALNNLDSAYYSILEIDSEDHPEYNQQKEDIRYLISKRILEIYASRQVVVNGHQDEIPIVLCSKQIVEQCGTCIADMQKTCW